MITKEMAVKLAKDRAETIQSEKLKLAEAFCEQTANEKIESAAKLGKYTTDINCNSEYAPLVANCLKEKGFAVRIDPINSHNSNLRITWNC